VWTGEVDSVDRLARVRSLREQIGSPLVNVTFAIRDIGRLVRNPDASLMCERPRKGKSYSYYPRRWLHEATAAYFASGGEPEAFRQALASLMETGQGPTKAKLLVAADLVSLLPALAHLSRQFPARYVSSLYRHAPPAFVWSGHRLKLPLGLLFEDENHGFVMRALWMESFLRPGVRGIDMTAAALAVTLPAGAGLACSVEPWFLRDTDRRLYPFADLRLARLQLDRLLSYAERLRQVSPAA
jgi:hypothetical protein